MAKPKANRGTGSEYDKAMKAFEAAWLSKKSNSPSASTRVNSSAARVTKDIKRRDASAPVRDRAAKKK